MPTDGTLSVDCAPTIGVDPGARWVGLCARVGREVVDASTVGRDDDGADPTADRLWVEKVLARVDALMATHGADAMAAGGTWRVAVEAVVQPKGGVEGRRVPASARVGWNVAQAALIYGSVLAVFPAAIIVAPAHHGERHLLRWGGSGAAASCYPPELCRYRPREFMPTDHPSGDRRHERSAYDVAGVAELAARVTV